MFGEECQIDTHYGESMAREKMPECSSRFSALLKACAEFLVDKIEELVGSGLGARGKTEGLTRISCVTGS